MSKFTTTQVEELRNRILADYGAKDTDFELVESVSEGDTVAIVHDADNRRITLADLRTWMREGLKEYIDAGDRDAYERAVAYTEARLKEYMDCWDHLVVDPQALDEPWDSEGADVSVDTNMQWWITMREGVSYERLLAKYEELLAAYAEMQECCGTVKASVSSLEAGLADEASARESADEVLADRVSVIEVADRTLKDAVDAEAKARAEADDALLATVNADAEAAKELVAGAIAHCDSNTANEAKLRAAADDGLQKSIGAVSDNLKKHIADYDNPHRVTAEQLGISASFSVSPSEIEADWDGASATAALTCNLLGVGLGWTASED